MSSPSLKVTFVDFSRGERCTIVVERTWNQAQTIHYLENFPPKTPGAAFFETCGGGGFSGERPRYQLVRAGPAYEKWLPESLSTVEQASGAVDDPWAPPHLRIMSANCLVVLVEDHRVQKPTQTFCVAAALLEQHDFSTEQFLTFVRASHESDAPAPETETERETETEATNGRRYTTGAVARPTGAVHRKQTTTTTTSTTSTKAPSVGSGSPPIVAVVASRPEPFWVRLLTNLLVMPESPSPELVTVVDHASGGLSVGSPKTPRHETLTTPSGSKTVRSSLSARSWEIAPTNPANVYVMEPTHLRAFKAYTEEKQIDPHYLTVVVVHCQPRARRTYSLVWLCLLLWLVLALKWVYGEYDVGALLLFPLALARTILLGGNSS